MKLRIIISCLFILVLASCGSKKNVVHKKKNPGVVLTEPEPTKLPYVDENKHVKSLEKSNNKLDKNVLRYIKKYAPIAVKEMHIHNIPASITLAQGVLESGSGRSELAAKSNNHFGIKCHTQWQGERVYHDDDEKGECFRKYQFVETSYNDHSAFLTKRKRYSFLFDYSKKDYRKWAKGLKKAGYATDKKYPNKLIRIIETYKLYDFDNIKKKDFIVTKGKLKYNKPKQTTNNFYVVKKGDTLYSLARKFKTSVVKLKELNELKDNNLNIGQRLLLK